MRCTALVVGSGLAGQGGAGGARAQAPALQGCPPGGRLEQGCRERAPAPSQRGALCAVTGWEADFNRFEI